MAEGKKFRFFEGFSPEREKIAQKIEVGYIPRQQEKDPPPDILVSIPVYGREWQNGRFLSHLEAHLRQRMPARRVLEISYLLNYPEEIEKTGELWQATEEMRAFLRKLIRIQTLEIKKRKLAHFPEERNSIEQEINNIFEETQNSREKEILQLALTRAEAIQFSYIDISRLKPEELKRLGYFGGEKLMGSLRTFGSDYARKRLRSSPRSIFQLSDIDTLPSSNNFYRRLWQHYQQNPQINFLFLPLGCQPPKTNVITFFFNVPHKSIEKTTRYNLALEGIHGSPQISVRASFLDEDRLDAVAATFPSSSGLTPRFLTSQCEDYATAKKILLTSPLEDKPSYPAEILLTEVREDGTGDDRYFSLFLMEEAVLFEDEMVENFLNRKRDLERKIRRSTNVDAIEKELKNAREKYRRELTKLWRFYRWGAREFLQQIEEGNIVLGGEGLQYRPETLSPSLRIYLERTKRIFQKVSPSDLEYLKYLLGIIPDCPTLEGGDESFPPLWHLLRHYFGEPIYAEPNQEWWQETLVDVRNRASPLFSLSVETMALGEISTRYFEQEEIQRLIKYHLGLDPSKPLSKNLINQIKPQTFLLSYDERTIWLQSHPHI